MLRAEAITSGKVTDKQLSRLESNIRDGYLAAQKLDRGTVTVKGDPKLGIKDVQVSGDRIVVSLNDHKLGASQNYFNDHKGSCTRTTKQPRTATRVSLSVTAASHEIDYWQRAITLHEAMHLNLYLTGWKPYDLQRQGRFQDAVEGNHWTAAMNPHPIHLRGGRRAMKWLIALSGCLVLSSHAADCSFEHSGGTRTERTIPLQTAQPSASFYYRVGQFTIMVESATLIGTLQAAVKKHAVPVDSRLLQEIRARAATSAQEYVDLFEFVLREPGYLLRVEGLLADLLEKGAANVLDSYALRTEPWRVVPNIVLVQIHDGAYSARQFCTQSGDKLLRITDSVR